MSNSLTSQVDIANLALNKLGQTGITSFNDNTTNARLVNMVWAAVRDSELRAYKWLFVQTRASLPAMSTTPAWQYQYQYQLPQECLRVTQVGQYNQTDLNSYIIQDDSLYAIEGSLILTNMPAPLLIKYSQRVTDTTVFDPCFVDMLAIRLAIELCETITNSLDKRQMLTKEYQAAMLKAISANAFEVPSEILPDTSWVIQRLVYGGQ